MERLPHSLKRYAETELICYKQNLDLLRELRDDIVLGGSSSILSGSRSAGVSDTTAMKAMRLLTDPKIRDIQNSVNCIKTCLYILSDYLIEIFQLLYIEQHPVQVVARKTGKSTRAIYYAKAEIVEKVAEKFAEQVR